MYAEHRRVDVAEQLHRAGAGERLRERTLGRVQAGVESLAGAQRKYVVKIGIVVAKRHAVADTDREHVGDERLAQLIDRTLASAARERRRTIEPFQPDHRGAGTDRTAAGHRAADRRGGRRRRWHRRDRRGRLLGDGRGGGRRGRARPATLAVRIGEQRRNHARDFRRQIGDLGQRLPVAHGAREVARLVSDAAAGHQVDDQILPLDFCFEREVLGRPDRDRERRLVPRRDRQRRLRGRRRRATRAARDQEGGHEHAGHHPYTTDVVSTLFSTTGAPSSS